MAFIQSNGFRVYLGISRIWVQISTRTLTLVDMALDMGSSARQNKAQKAFLYPTKVVQINKKRISKKKNKIYVKWLMCFFLTMKELSMQFCKSTKWKELSLYLLNDLLFFMQNSVIEFGYFKTFLKICFYSNWLSQTVEKNKHNSYAEIS